METKDVSRREVPNAKCYDCGKQLGESAGFATYIQDGQKVYKCDACYEADPILHRKTEVYSRVVGYMRPVEQWNVGKQTEFRDRRVFDGGGDN
jgi:anaerobic ribonucleoside-triphosphate reductase